MYYIRGAFNAASQYYKDLPTINPSTLTGAIDVIVVERPTADGGTELAGSPFHVRFGKLQVLRPSDRKVSVMLNGHPVPYKMKIGDAGEAFWIFETDDDVPEDLITSPILEPTQTPAASPPPTGAFGASLESPQSASQLGGADRRQANSVTDDEPEFLDLDATGPKRRPKSLDISALTASRAAPFLSQPPTSSIGPSDVLNRAAALGNVVPAATGEAKAAITSAVDEVKNAVASHHSDTGKALGVTPEDLMRDGEAEARPPDVQDENGVAVDTLGYHARGASERTIIRGRFASMSRLKDERPISNHSTNSGFHFSSQDASSESDHSPASTRPSSPETQSIFEARSGQSIGTRATSEPPEIADGLASSQEYSWPWGELPLKTPMITDDNLQFSLADAMSTSTSLPTEVDGHLKPSSKRGLAQHGRLAAGEGSKIILTMGESWKEELELSLCDPHQVATFDQSFKSHLVSFQRFLDDESIVTSPLLVVKWNHRYTTRQDAPALFSALIRWRQIALGRSPNAASDEEPLSSADERELQPLARQSSAAPVSRTASTWSRWWRGSSGNTTPALKERPSLKEAASAPAGIEIAPIVEPVERRIRASAAALVPPKRGTKYVKTLRLTSDQLRELNLRKGVNTITFSLSAAGPVACTARVFLWDWTDLIVVSDIDGTITKSDALGHVMTFMGRDWTHSGVAKLYTDISRNGYRLMYLTSRAIGQAGSTRHYLQGVNQDNYQLPDGPVIMSPDRLFTSLHREVIMRRPEVFKMACLQDIQRLFGSRNPFYAGFGNRITDAASYLKVDIPRARIFTIEYSGDVKMELLERSGFKSSYIHMTDLVDQMFPPVHRSVSPQFTDLNFWRTPIANYDLPDLTPPSPTLSAQSEPSRLGRLTSAISLLSSRSRSPASGSASRAASQERSERLPYHIQDVDSSLASMTDEEFLARVRRKQSMDSLPPSLSSSWRDRWDMENRVEEEPSEQDDDADEEDEDEDEEDLEAEAEHAFEDDLLATGEMDNVPFL